MNVQSSSSGVVFLGHRDQDREQEAGGKEHLLWGKDTVRNMQELQHSVPIAARMYPNMPLERGHE